MLILAIAENLDELFQNRCLTAIASLGKFGGVVIVAVNTALVLVIAVRCAEDGRTDGTREMLDVVFSIQCGDVGSSKGLTAIETQKI